MYPTQQLHVHVFAVDETAVANAKKMNAITWNGSRQT
jgi:hypothetical protein